ncbi:MAG: potassium channel family protein [Thermoleophilia bacterium]|nr:potassium channel family protein [Thermoleophilia bacterium]
MASDDVMARMILRGSIKPGYDMFIVIVTVLSITNWILLMISVPGESKVTGLLIFMEPIFTVILLADFGYRLKLAKGQRWKYMNRGGGWLDLLGSLPYGRLLRLFRLYRVLQGFREFGWRNTIRWFVAHRANGTLFLVLGLLIIVLEFGGLAVLWFEADAPGANIRTGGEALWWGVVTVTTVGYGDYYPVTPGGEVVATIMIFAGVAIIAIFTAWVASTFLNPSSGSSSASGDSGAPAPAPSDQDPGGVQGGEHHDDAHALIHDLRARLDRLEAAIARKPDSD